MLLRALHRHLRPWAQTRRLGEARSGAIIVVQRFGGALNLNVHLHALVLDGVFARAGDGQLGFHRAPPPGVSGRRPLRLGYGEGRMLEGASGLNQALAWNAPDFKAVILSAQMRLVCHII
ncbi:MAG: transposase [Vicinamibacterales bacterium]